MAKNNDNALVLIIAGLSNKQATKMLDKVVTAKQFIAPEARGIANIVKNDAIGTCLQNGMKQIGKK